MTSKLPCAARRRDALRLAAYLADRVDLGHPVPNAIQLALIQPAGRGAAAVDPVVERNALFVLPDDNFERPPRRTPAS